MQFDKGLALSLVTFWIVGPAHAQPLWQGSFYTIGDIYTYGNENTLSVFLDGVQCPNQKDYYVISPAQVNNAKQLITMVLTAKAAGQSIQLFVDTAVDAQNCYIKGAWVTD